MLFVVALALVVLALGYLVARGAAAFSSFDPATVRLVTEYDHLKRPVKWEDNKDYRARLNA